MRKLLGWTVGLVALPLALVLVAVAKATNCKDRWKAAQEFAYKVGLSDLRGDEI